MKIIEMSLKNEGVTLTAYIPDSSKEMPRMATRPAVLVIPGGGYSFCSDREAEPVALSFNAKGYAAFVLRYTIGKDKDFSAPFADVNEAMEIIHSNASEWNIDKEKVAAIGFSAGGHLCAALSTMGEIRPNASILIYPCILESMGEILAFPVPSLEKEVDENTPATFIAAAREDGLVPIKNSIAYAAALEEADIPFEIHIFEKGYHGFSIADHTVYSKAEEEYNAHLRCWVELCMNWLCKRFEL